MRALSDVRERLRVVIRGAVQGVGFRPFIYRLATELKLAGWVLNSSQGVFIEVEGEGSRLREFLLRIERDKPPLSFIHSLEPSWLDAVGFSGFEIRHSDGSEPKTALVLPDIATCPDCLADISNPADRRYRYPFTNCTNCGPRFSIVRALPYDRPNTTMAGFPMCPDCLAEYENPLDRRFHAQPTACPRCGPQLALWDSSGGVLAERHEALLAAAQALRDGRVVAVKGLGGFHLLVDARNADAIVLLRQRKQREEKPLALMYPSLDAIRQDCAVDELEQRLLASPEAPIVLLERLMQRPGTGIADAVAPGNPHLGVMLPYTPLHHILLRELGYPIVATSGNLSDETICTDEREALSRLAGIADLFLVHDRPIEHHVDDSIARIVAGRELVLRRARGYAPLPVRLRQPLRPVLAVGAHLKNNVALSVGRQVFISQHIGDLETAQTLDTFRKVIGDFERLYETRPAVVACDMHPDYLSTRYARESGVPVVEVQHHYAHVLACMAENELEPPVLGVSWDGTGYGSDHTVWGGEFLVAPGQGFTRAAHLRTFMLPGGDAAVKQPRRTALGLLYEMTGPAAFELKDCPALQAFTTSELGLLRQMLERGVNAPRTSSAGRLFDAVASICGLRQQVRYEGQAAMELEFALASVETEESYPLAVSAAGAGLALAAGTPQPAVIDWQPLVEAVLADLRRGAPLGLISARFHNALAEVIVAIARIVGLERVALSGGCFQNKYLTEQAVRRLAAAGFRPYWHQRVPPNDGCIALGQTIAAGTPAQGD